jgi:hypothetical protein
MPEAGRQQAVRQYFWCHDLGVNRLPHCRHALSRFHSCLTRYQSEQPPMIRNQADADEP